MRAQKDERDGGVEGGGLHINLKAAASSLCRVHFLAYEAATGAPLCQPLAAVPPQPPPKGDPLR